MTFKTEKDLESIAPPAPGAQPITALWVKNPILGVRIMPPTKKALAAWEALSPKRKAKTHPQGTLSWFVRVQGAAGREPIGRYPAMTLEEAELHAITLSKEAKEAKADGTVSSDKTIADVWILYKAANLANWRPTTLANYEKKIEYLKVKEGPEDTHHSHTKHGIWAMKARKVRSADLILLFAEIREKGATTNKDRGLPGDGASQAASVGRFLHALLTFAIGMQTIRINPMLPFKKQLLKGGRARRVRHIKVQDIPRFFHWLDEHAHEAGRDFILITLFMCLRKSVTANLKWEQLDTRRWTLAIPKEVEGNKADEKFIHPIPDYLIAKVFEPRFKDPNRHPIWILPSVSRDPLRKGKEAVKDVRSLLEGLYKQTAQGRCKRCRRDGADGIKISPQDWRRSFATWMHQSSSSELLTRRALSHDLQAAGDMEATSAGYVISETEELRVAMNDMTEYVFGIVNNPKVVDEQAYEASAARVARMLRRDKRKGEADADAEENDAEAA